MAADGRLERSLRETARGLGQRIRDANWQGITREVAIVVLGILIAFQFDRWGEQWAERREERKLLERLAEETAGDLVALRAIRDDHRGRADEALLVSRAIGEPEVRALLSNGEDPGCGMLRLPAARLHSGVFGDLATADLLTAFSDERLRSLIRHAMAERAFNGEQLHYFRDAFQRFGSALDPYTRWRFEGDEQLCRVAVDELARDPAAVSLLARVYRDQNRFVEYRTREIDALERVEQRVACLRAGTCGD